MVCISLRAWHHSVESSKAMGGLMEIHEAGLVEIDGLHVDERYQSQFESRTDSFAAVVYV